MRKQLPAASPEVWGGTQKERCSHSDVSQVLTEVPVISWFNSAVSSQVGISHVHPTSCRIGQSSLSLGSHREARPWSPEMSVRPLSHFPLPFGPQSLQVLVVTLAFHCPQFSPKAGA